MEKTENNKKGEAPVVVSSVENMEINLLYIMAMSMERIVNDVEWRLARKGRAFQFEKKRRFTNIMKAIKNIKVNSDIMDEVDFAEGLKGRMAGNYQGYQEDAQRLARILLLLADRDSADPQNLYDVQKLLREQKGYGVITEEVLKNFYLQKYNG